jgi:7,8-dihydropterin-6-yl-methyl-4-(beta-D-ribofuranosyl)aminobenzene 5'-phosphate synthase
MNIATTKITVLIDNQASAGLIAEHGFSLWIETAGKRILFDTGQGRAFEKNAGALGIDLSTTDMLVLSHGHYDHTGGVSWGLHQAGRATLYCHPGVVHPRYNVQKGESKSLQMPHITMAAIDKLSWERVRWVRSSLMLTDTVGLTGPIQCETLFEDIGGRFFLDPDGLRPDPMDDEMALWIRTDQGLIVCVGCAHMGLVNTLYQVQNLNKGMRIRAVIGGFHLLQADESRLAQTVAALQDLELDLIVPCHCTGVHVIDYLCGAFAEKCCPGAAGKVYVF